jgi:hypothetical protein
MAVSLDLGNHFRASGEAKPSAKPSISKDRSPLSSPPVRRRRMIHSLFRPVRDSLQTCTQPSATFVNIADCSHHADPLTSLTAGKCHQSSESPGRIDSAARDNWTAAEPLQPQPGRGRPFRAPAMPSSPRVACSPLRLRSWCVLAQRGLRKRDGSGTIGTGRACHHCALNPPFAARPPLPLDASR